MYVMSGDISGYLGSLPFDIKVGTRNEDALIGRLLEPFDILFFHSEKIHTKGFEGRFSSCIPYISLIGIHGVNLYDSHRIRLRNGSFCASDIGPAVILSEFERKRERRQD